MNNLLKPIVLHYQEKQIIQAIEEFSELIKELCKNSKGKSNKNQIKEEMADCYIMLEQLKILFKFNSQEIEAIMFNKIKRTLNIIDQELTQKVKKESN
ncbi:hypothetical protein [Spiroplasma sp. SV19]|uniref:hypothetical protein n=1 Tax=Spiroplasma sp. SV19 TaxID=2570468 RepID=UPI0024B6909D|nr:hypothetical protein [Spiroplasma sp. SV19]WHQ37085.1 hypothetical protein E7Y35_04205 [Spiroplasma sp. SV19]